MNNYEKPVVLENEDAFEGVYAASGVSTLESDCWIVEVNPVQEWNGWAKVFKVNAQHSREYLHISTETVVTITFNNTLSSSSSAEFASSVSGDTMTITRTLHANGYKSGDSYTYDVYASTGDEATTRALAVKSCSIRGTKAPNVQGGFD